MKTSIEWTDVVWNPVRGCALVSAGCQNCYAMKQAHRFSGTGMPYEGLTERGPNGPRWTGNIRLVPEALEAPLHWKKPRRVFVNSMSDLFHEDVPFQFIGKVFATMFNAPQHTFQILTKRPQRMRDFIEWRNGHILAEHWAQFHPIKNIWLGVSVEDQATADERIPILLQTPAAVHWISAEPLLGPVDLDKYTDIFEEDVMDVFAKVYPGLDWVVVGGESGPGARPCDLALTRSIVDQCQAAEVRVFVKQLGARWYDRDAHTGINGSCAVPVDDHPWMWVTQRDRKGGDMTDPEFPEDLKLREYPG